MKKIPSLFVREFDTSRKNGRILRVLEDVTPGCEWVLAGEGAASAKYDGEAHRIRFGALYRRYNQKPGRTAPAGFEPCETAPDPTTGHWPGWVPVRDDDPAGRWSREAFHELWRPFDAGLGRPADGTYELIGPKVQGNPHRWARHELVLHGCTPVTVEPTYAAIRDWLVVNAQWEGLVWAHPDGRYAKIKRGDFGLPWPPEAPRA